MKIKFILALAAALMASPASAEIDDTDRQAIRTAFDKLLTVIRQGNFAEMFTTMPPKLLDKMAEQAGTNAETLKTIAAAQIKEAMGKVTISDVSYDLDGATTGTSETGRDYAIISTRTVMKIDEMKLAGVSPSLAMEDEGKWYIVRIEGPQHVQLIGAVYPDLAGLTFPQSTMGPAE